MSHAALRASERIACENPGAVANDLKIALADPDKWADYIEPVVGLRDNSKAYRFRVAEGIFYCIARNGYPVTILTQEQMAAKKRSIRAVRQRPGWMKREKITAV